jgi:WD40 repeat protein
MFDLALATPDRIATLTDERVHALWDATSLTPVPVTIAQNYLRDITVTDGIVIGSTLTGLWFEKDGAIIGQAPLASSFCLDVTTTASGRRLLAVGSVRGTIHIYDATDPTQLLPLRTITMGASTVATVKFRSGGDVVAASSGNILKLYEPESGTLIAQAPPLPAMLLQLVWSPDGTRLAIAGAAGAVWIWNLAPGTRDGLEQFVRCVSPLKLEDSSLSIRTEAYDPATCPSEVLRSR